MSASLSEPAPSTSTGPPRLAAWGWAAIAFVFLAVALEVLGGQYANSRVPSAAEWLVPLGWPQPIRVIWWIGVGAAAGTFRYSEHRAGIRRNPVLVIASVVPFFVFAFGIAVGASFSTWH